jgi:hypothetical protein
MLSFILCARPFCFEIQRRIGSFAGLTRRDINLCEGRSSPHRSEGLNML